MEAAPGASFSAVADLGTPGFTPGVQVVQQGVAVIARTTVGIVEDPPNTYTAALTAPATAGKYTIVWDTGAVAAGSMAIEDLLVGDTTVGAGDSYESVADLLQIGLVGTAGVMVTDDSDSSVVIAHTTLGIAEFPAGSGIYWTLLTAPASGEYTVVWDNGAGEEATEPLVVIGATTPVGGPCTDWATGDEVLACCNAEGVGTDTSLFDGVIGQAQELLFALSGRLYAGQCQKTVRPCSKNGGWCGMQVLSRGHVVWSMGGGGWWGNGMRACGCSPLDEVWLSGYPVREIVEVKIDGVVVDPDTYDLRENRFLVRMNDPVTGEALTWPSCQNMARRDTEEGTFAVTYLYGADPPLAAQQAAAELACELWKACTPGAGECQLPTGVTRVVRQGIVIERLAFTAWGLQQGIWRTGLTRVDAFLNAFNPKRHMRRPSSWSPDGPRYARPVG